MTEKKKSPQRSIYFNEEDHEAIARLMARSGLGRSAVIRWAIHNADQQMDQIERMVQIRSAAEEIISLTQT